MSRSSRDHPHPGIEPKASAFPALQTDSLPLSHQGSDSTGGQNHTRGPGSARVQEAPVTWEDPLLLGCMGSSLGSISLLSPPRRHLYPQPRATPYSDSVGIRLKCCQPNSHPPVCTPHPQPSPSRHAPASPSPAAAAPEEGQPLPFPFCTGSPDPEAWIWVGGEAKL